MCYLLVLTRDSDEKFNSMSIEYKKIIDGIRTATYDKPSKLINILRMFRPYLDNKLGRNPTAEKVM